MRVLLLVLAACWTGAPPPPPADDIPSAFAITLERTPCLGRCPSYAVTLDSDGRIYWDGREHVATRGRHRATIPPRRVRPLEQKVTELRFFERDERGELPRQPVCSRGACSFPTDTICSDTSVAIITVRRGEQTHTVRNDHCKPSALDALEAMIDDTARTSIWIRTRVVAPDAGEPPPAR